MVNSFLSAESNLITWVFVVLLVVLVAVLLVVPMFTNKKRSKQIMELHNSLQPGDVIKTVGGIIGTIKEIRQVSPLEREMVIETGDEDSKSTMTFDIQALYQVVSRVNAAPAGDVFGETAAAPAEQAVEEAPVAEEAPAAAPVEEHAEEPAPVEPVAEEAAAEEAPAEEPAKEQAAEEAPAEKKPAAKKSTGAKKNSTKK